MNKKNKLQNTKSNLRPDGVSPQVHDCGPAVVGESVPVVMHDRPQVVGASPRIDLRVAELVEVVPDPCEPQLVFQNVNHVFKNLLDFYRRRVSKL